MGETLNCIKKLRNQEKSEEDVKLKREVAVKDSAGWGRGGAAGRGCQVSRVLGGYCY
jgi:hypothetical protein